MKFSTKQVSRGAVIAALYAAMCFLLEPISYGSMQFRISEVLTVLPIFMPEAVIGLFIGCVIANALGGASIAILDMVLGSLTTLCAAILTRAIYKKTKSVFLALIPPVILNALIVGSYVPFLYSDPGSVTTLPIVLISMLSVGIGQAAVIYILGVPLGKALLKTRLFSN